MKIIQLVEVTEDPENSRAKKIILGLSDDGNLYMLQMAGKTHMGRIAYKWTPLAIDKNTNE